MTDIALSLIHIFLDEAQAGDNIGALLRGVQRTEIERGQVLAKPGSVHPHKKFTAQVYVLTKDEGGISDCRWTGNSRYDPDDNGCWIYMRSRI